MTQSKKFQIIIVVITLVFSFLAAATFNPSRVIKLPGTIDPRLTGIQYNGWTADKFSFEENLIYPWSARVGIAFDTKRPQSAGAANVEFFLNGVSQGERLITRQPIYFDLPRDANNIKIEGIVKNPFISVLNEEAPQSEEDSEESLSNNSPTPNLSIPKVLGVSITRIELEPKYFFLIPNGKILITLLSLLCLGLSLVVLISSFDNFSSFSILYAGVIISLVNFFLLSKSKYFGWERGSWIYIPVTIFLLGFIFGKKILQNKVSFELNNSIFSKYTKLFLVLLFIFSLWLRLSAVGFGLPDLYHPDESRKLSIARSIVITSNWDPDYFKHPSFMVYSTAILGKIKYYFTNTVPTVSDLAILGRSVSATFGALTIIAVFAVTSLLFNQSSGLLAAVIVAISPLHLVCSRYIKEDVVMIFFSLAALFLVLKFILKESKSSYLILSGFLVGIASSVKYTGVLSGLFILAPLILLTLEKYLPFLIRVLFKEDIKKYPIFNDKYQNLITNTLIALALIPIGFLIITPYSVINSKKFLTDVFFESHHMTIGHSGIISAAQYLFSFHFEYSFRRAIGSLTFWLSLFSLGFFLSERKIRSLVPFCGFLLFFLPAEWVNAKPFPQAERYILPTLPFLAISTSGFLFCSFENIIGKKVLSYIRTIIIFACISSPLIYSLTHTFATSKDTRELSKNWVIQNIPKGSIIVTDWLFYGPNISANDYKIIELKSPKADEVLSSISIENLKETGASYFITSSFFYNRYLYQIPAGDKIGLAYQKIFADNSVFVEFSNPQVEYGFHNPTIKIFKLSQ